MVISELNLIRLSTQHPIGFIQIFLKWGIEIQKQILE
jgi:hypothetical protein